jgi:acyl-CoA reductase-like NAD-dependent aldehyde dehydrogenase
VIVGILHKFGLLCSNSLGTALNPKSTIGPLISRASLSRTEQVISRLPSHVHILTGGKRLASPSQFDSFDRSEGNFFPPTIVEGVRMEDELWQEEVFGPVVALTKFSGGETEALRLANACKYGLGAGIWTSDVGRAVRVSAGIDAGLVWVNTHHRNDPSSPW